MRRSLFTFDDTPPLPLLVLLLLLPVYQRRFLQRCVPRPQVQVRVQPRDVGGGYSRGGGGNELVSAHLRREVGGDRLRGRACDLDVWCMRVRGCGGRRLRRRVPPSANCVWDAASDGTPIRRIGRRQLRVQVRSFVFETQSSVAPPTPSSSPALLLPWL